MTTPDSATQLTAAPTEIVVGRAKAVSKLAAAYELTKPRMNFLVVATTAVGFYLAAGAAGTLEHSWLLVNTLLGTALTAAAASVFNQLAEREADGLMRRTARRPLPAGHLTASTAMGMGIGLGLVGTLWLTLLVNPLTAALALFTLLSYVLVYTPLKKRTPLCTVVGALPGAIPPMMGVSAVSNELTASAWVLFAILFVWQMPHFYGLALLYREDYARGGFAMLPLQPDGMARTTRQSLLWLILLIPISLLPTVLGITGWYYAAAALALGTWFLSAGVACWWTRQKLEARRLFITSVLHLPLLLVAMMLDRI